MDRGKRPNKFVGMSNYKIYMGLKEIIREHALQYLPAKSLFKFQSVCRDWKLQISNPFFAHNQSLSCRSILGLFGQAPGGPSSFISFDTKSCGVPDPLLGFIPEPVQILSSSSGLLCCQACSNDKAYYICNPVTRQWKKLPKPNANHGSDPAIVLVFEPSLLNFDVDYKLICAFRSNDFDDAIEFEIYSSREGSWKVSGEICFASRTVIPRSGVHVDNVIYWHVMQGGSILAFDLIKERSQLLKAFYSHAGAGAGALGNMNGKLCSAYANGHSICLYVLGNKHSNTMQMSSHVMMWTGKRNIDLDSRILGGDAAKLKVVFVGSDIMVVQCGKSICSYDLKTKETRLLSTQLTSERRIFLPYVNSIVSI